MRSLMSRHQSAQAEALKATDASVYRTVTLPSTQDPFVGLVDDMEVVTSELRHLVQEGHMLDWPTDFKTLLWELQVKLHKVYTYPGKNTRLAHEATGEQYSKPDTKNKRRP